MRWFVSNAILIIIVYVLQDNSKVDSEEHTGDDVTEDSDADAQVDHGLCGVRTDMGRVVVSTSRS